MAEPESQDEDETVASDLEEVKTDTTDTDVTEESGAQTPTKSTDYESETSEGIKKRPWTDKRYAESRLSPEKKDGRETTASNVARVSGGETVEGTLPLRERFPLGGGGFLLEHRDGTAVGLGRRRRTRIRKSMKRRQPTKTFWSSGNERLWPSVSPCLARDTTIMLEAWGKEGRKRRRDVFPCDPLDDDGDEFFLRQQRSDFANRKELGHARMPVTRPDLKLDLSVDDCAVGDRPGLVNGDGYVIVELPNDRVYAIVVLHGLKGMPLREIISRERWNTWKFCLYQAVVALLAKTQLRYKYAWSANIDYIYDHAWMLYTHIGTIGVKAKQYLDDVVVYNYKYSVEIEFIGEINNVIAGLIFPEFKEEGLKKQITLSRKDPLQVTVELGSQKVTDSGYMSVHKDVPVLEQWLDELIAQYSDQFILKTLRFSLAFWRDGLFWYLYNPYRCNEYGLWDNHGRACIVKFCSADSLRRHLMILMMRAHAYEKPLARDEIRSNFPDEGYIYLDVQLFHVSFRYCQLDNLKLLSKQRRVDECPSDSLEIKDQEDEAYREEDEEDDSREPRERATWLRRHRETTWGKYAPASRKRPGSAEVTAAGKARWHQYYVEEPNRLFSLWGEIHITDNVFDEANRGMQAYACYVVCAGMTRIMAPEYWTPKTLDSIVVCGDRYYTRSRREVELKSVSASPSSKYLSDRFEIGEILFEARMLPAVRGRLYAESDECLWSALERVFSSYHFAALTCESACLGLFKFCGAYYVCDVNSFGPPLFQYGRGAAYLLRATSFRKFVTVLVLLVGSPERSRFTLNPIEILRIVEVDAALESRAKTRERRNRFVGKIPGKLPRFVSDGQKKGKMKK